MNKTTTQIDQSKLKSKASPAGLPRYKKGLFPAYDKEYFRLANSSIFLSDSDRRDFKNAFAKGGLSECKSSLLKLVGNDDGRYKEEKTWYTALLPAAKNNLKEVYADFKRWQTEQVQNGHALKPPKQWPDGLLQERLKAEARLDVRRNEKSFLENRIKELKKKQGKNNPDDPILPHGPVGSFVGGSTGKGKIKSVDGQAISFSSFGIPYISEPDSPYHLMPIVTYREMSKQWKKEQGITLDQLREYRDRLFKEERKKAILADEEPPEKRLPVTHSKIPFWMKRLGITKDDWPEWPADAKPITELEQLESLGS